MLYQLVNKTLETRLLFLLKPICSIIEINLSISLLCGGARIYSGGGPSPTLSFSADIHQKEIVSNTEGKNSPIYGPQNELVNKFSFYFWRFMRLHVLESTKFPLRESHTILIKFPSNSRKNHF